MADNAVARDGHVLPESGRNREGGLAASAGAPGDAATAAACQVNTKVAVSCAAVTDTLRPTGLASSRKVATVSYTHLTLPTNREV